MPERRDALLLYELVLNERVEEFVVEGLGPGLAREHCVEVCAVLTHDLLEADHGGALGGCRHVLGRGRDPDDVRAVMSEHRLVLRDAQLRLRVGESHPHQHVHHPRSIVVVGDGRQELVERLDCYGFTLSCKRADRPHLVLCLFMLRQTKGVARGFPQANPSSRTFSPYTWWNYRPSRRV